MSQFIASPLVKVLVGPEDTGQEFSIHKHIITSRSKFFASALNGHWERPEANTVDLYKFNPKLTASQVALYLEAVYTDRITKKGTAVKADISYPVYVMVEQMLDLRTRNFAPQALYERIRQKNWYGNQVYHGLPCVIVIYDGTATASNPMRRFLVDVYCDLRGRSELARENIENIPKEFLHELALKALKGGDGRPDKTLPFTYDMENYLEKENGDKTKDTNTA